MRKLRISICKLGSVVLTLFLLVDASAAVLARQCGAVGIVTYDPLPDPTAPDAYTRTTVVPVPYAWLLQNWPGTVDEYYSYEAAAKAASAVSNEPAGARSSVSFMATIFYHTCRPVCHIDFQFEIEIVLAMLETGCEIMVSYRRIAREGISWQKGTNRL